MKPKLPLIVLGMLIFAACESYDCTLYNYVGMFGAFYREGAAVTLQDTLTITSGKNGPFLLNQKTGTTRFSLQMSYWQDVDTLVLNVKGEDYNMQDTIWMKKSNQVHYESPDCPATLFHTIGEVRSTHQFIDSITVIRSSVNYELTTNIQIHLQ